MKNLNVKNESQKNIEYVFSCKLQLAAEQIFQISRIKSIKMFL